MSQFLYNYVELSLVKTNSVERIPRLSDDRVDYLWTDFIININCIYSPGSTSYPAPGFLPAETDAEIRGLLMQPRRPLYYAEGGIPILAIPSNLANGGAIDSEDGPTPLLCTITRIASSRLFFINYVIKASVIECPVGGFIDAVASTRYSRTENIDGQFRSTMITTGKAYFRSDVLVALASDADSFRGYIIPPPLLSFRRKSISANLAPNGIMMEFITVDEEQFVDLGSTSLPGTAASIGIVEMDLNYETSTYREGPIGMAGMGGYVRIDAMAMGTRASRDLDMAFFLYRCIFNKLGDLVNQKEAYVVDISSKENMFKKTVSLSMTYFTIKPKNNAPDLAINIRDNFENGTPLASLPNVGGINPQPPFSNATRGLTPVQLAARAFANACVSQDSICSDLTGTSVPPDLYNQCGIRGVGVQIAVYSNENVPDITNRRQDGKVPPRSMDNNQSAPYIKYQLKSEYTGSLGNTQLPMSSLPQQPTSLGGTSTSSTGSSSGSGPKPTSVVIQLFQPTLRKVCSFVIERIGALPEIPSPTVTVTPQNQTYTLLDSSLTPIGIELMPDAYTPIYRIAGVYTYACARPFTDDESIPFDIPPWVDIEPSEFTQVTSNDLLGGIINWQTF